MISKSRWAALLMVGALLVLTGCQANYVNIPANTGDVASHDPNGSLVRKTEKIALKQAVTQLNPQGQVMVVLPQGTTKLTYAALLPQVSDQAVAPDAEDANPAMTLTVKAVRVRGLKGQVDISYKAPDTPAQLMTVYLKQSMISGWSVTRTRQWTGVAE